MLVLGASESKCRLQEGRLEGSKLSQVAGAPSQLRFHAKAKRQGARISHLRQPCPPQVGPFGGALLLCNGGEGYVQTSRRSAEDPLSPG